MSERRRLLDTNLIIQALVPGHEAHTQIARKLFESCDRGEVELILHPAVLAECVFVLQSIYKQPRPLIAGTLSGIVDTPGIMLQQTAIYLDALMRFGTTKAHFVDCVLAAFAAAQNIPVATFDAGFQKFMDVTVQID